MQGWALPRVGNRVVGAFPPFPVRLVYGVSTVFTKMWFMLNLLSCWDSVNPLTLPHVPFPFPDFASYLFAVINQSYPFGMQSRKRAPPCPNPVGGQEPNWWVPGSKVQNHVLQERCKTFIFLFWIKPIN